MSVRHVPVVTCVTARVSSAQMLPVQLATTVEHLLIRRLQSLESMPTYAQQDFTVMRELILQNLALKEHIVQRQVSTINLSVCNVELESTVKM